MRSTNNGAKNTLSDGVSFRYVRGIGLDDDSKRYTQLLKPSLELRPSIAVYFAHAEACRVRNLLGKRVESLCRCTFSFNGNSPPHTRSGRP